MGGTTPDIDEVVGLLDSLDTASLNQLRRDYPEHADLLEPGIVLGVTEPALRMRAEASLKAMQASTREIQRVLPEALTRLQGANRLEAIGHVCTLLGSAGAIVTALNDLRSGTMLAASIAFIGALATAGVQYYRRGILGGPNSLIESCSQMLELKARAEELLAELKIVLSEQSGEIGNDAVMALVKESNSVARQVKHVVPMIPGR